MVNSRLDHFKINDNLIENLKFYFDGKFPFEGLGLKNLSNNYNWPRKGDFPTSKLYELEMSLFADAESLADRYLKT
mgnify:CR=1 FL=1